MLAFLCLHIQEILMLLYLRQDYLLFLLGFGSGKISGQLFIFLPPDLLDHFALGGKCLPAAFGFYGCLGVNMVLAGCLQKS